MTRRRIRLWRQRGAALLLAMMIVALIVTAAAGMVWLQTRAARVEEAERLRAQAEWILSGALDWARLILREDLRTDQRNGALKDSLDEAWATPLEEARLSTFLAADQSNNTEGVPEAFLSGSIVDAQSRLNLRSLIDANGKPAEAQVAALQALADRAGAPSDTAARIAEALALVSPRAPSASDAASGASAQPAAVVDTSGLGPPLKPSRLEDLVWMGIDAATLARLAPWVDLLPQPTPVNANTASREVLMAAIAGLDAGTAERIVQTRQRQAFRSLPEVQQLLTERIKAEATQVSVNSSWFIVSGRLRLEDRVLEERSLVQRADNNVQVRSRERRSFTAAPPR